MVSKEVTNADLFEEITGLRKGILKNREAIVSNRKAILTNKKEIRKNGKRIDKLLKLYFSIEKRVTNVEERIVLFPDFFNKVDVLVAEIIEGRPEKALMLARIENHEKRITTLELK